MKITDGRKETVMPRKSEKLRLSETQDRRKKLIEEQRKEIRDLRSTGLFSLNDLAKRFGVSKKLILLIVNPDSAENAKQYRKENWRNWQRTGEEWNKIIREHRQYKQELYLDGQLK